MFIWTVKRILAEIGQSMPDLAQKLERIRLAWDSPRHFDELDAVWPTLRPQTIDFGVMEKAQKVAVVPAADMEWNDVGSWESLYDVFKGDDQGNIVINSEHLAIDSKNLVILNENPDRLVATIGVDDLVVVDTGRALLICSRDRAQDVRQVVDRLKKEGRDLYL